MVSIDDVTNFLFEMDIKVFDSLDNYRKTEDILNDIVNKINNENREKQFKQIQTFAKLFK